MADVTRNEQTGEVTQVRYRDTSNYAVEVQKHSPFPGRVRITTKNAGGGGYPVDLERQEARKLFRDGLDLLGGEDD